MAYENNTYYKAGQWNVHCDVCGFKFKSGDIKKRWDGLMVCPDDWERDHPQKFLRVEETSQAVPFVRHQTDNTFILVCYLWDQSAYADLGTADCSQADNTRFTYQYLLDLKNASSG